MAISVSNPVAVVPGGGINISTLPISAPALTANQAHLISVTLNAGNGAVVSTPAGYSLVGSTPLTATSTSSLYVFIRRGVASAGTVTLTFSAAGRASAAHVRLDGVDPVGTSPVQTFNVANTLTAPSLTATTGTMLVTCFGVREGSAITGPPNRLTITQPTGMTEAVEADSNIDNNATQVATEISHLTVGAGATGTKAATTDANSGFIAGAVALLLVPETAAVVAPNAPVISTLPATGQVTVNWTAPPNGGSAITGYTLQRRTYTAGTPGAWGTINSPAAGATSYADTGRTNGTQYGYQLSATNAIGTSAYSTEATATPSSTLGTGFIGFLQKIPGLIHYYPLTDTYKTGTTIKDVIGTLDGTLVGAAATFSSAGVRFTGAANNYITIPDHDDLSLRGKTAVDGVVGMTILVGMKLTDRADVGTLRDDGFVHWLGKGESGQHEWTWRVYNNPDNVTGQSRHGRVSFYHYSLAGGLGTGSYVEDQTQASGVENVLCGGLDLTTASNTAASFPGANGFGSSFPGGTFIWKNGVERECDGFQSGGGGTNINPQNGTAPVTIGCRNDQDSWLDGTVRRLAVFNRKLSTAEVKSIYDNWGLAEGTVGSPSGTVPTPPQNVQASRVSGDSSKAVVTWSAPSSDGGSSVTGYVVSWVGGNTSGTSSLLSTSASPYTLTGLPGSSITVTVVARNSVGDSGGGTATIPTAGASVPIGSITDTFEGTPSPTRVFDPGVVQQNGAVQAVTIDATPRGTYVRGDMSSQSAFMKITPLPNVNDVTAFFVRVPNDRSKQIRIVVQNSVIYGRFDDGTADTQASSRPYNAANDRYWRIVQAGTVVRLETSPNGSAWTSLGRSGFTAPAWLTDVQVGVEEYNSATI